MPMCRRKIDTFENLSKMRGGDLFFIDRDPKKWDAAKNIYAPSLIAKHME